MKFTTSTLALAGATFVHGQSSPGGSGRAYQYLQRVCYPRNSTGYPDFNAPCNAVMAIESECFYGPEYFQKVLSHLSGNQAVKHRSLLQSRQSDPFSPDSDYPVQSNATQRICFCESQFFDQAAGCSACSEAHGNPVPDFTVGDKDNLASLSSSYCATSNTPTAGFADIIFEYANSILSSLPVTTQAFSTFSDPLGNRTDVSLYFTASVTGSAAWVVAEQTATGSAGTFTAVNTADGQIRPTAAGSAGGSGSSGSETTSGNAAMRTEAVAAAGIVGLAGLVALL